MKDWLAAEGSEMIGCEDGRGSVKASFVNLVPDGVYTMWFALVPTPPTEPFTGRLDLPVGPRDGSGSVFTADDAGNASFQASFDGCLEGSAANFMSILAVAWHSDGMTYGSSPGPFGEVTHVQLFAPLPKSAGGQS